MILVMVTSNSGHEATKATKATTLLGLGTFLTGYCTPQRPSKPTHNIFFLLPSFLLPPMAPPLALLDNHDSLLGTEM